MHAVYNWNLATQNHVFAPRRRQLPQKTPGKGKRRLRTLGGLAVDIIATINCHPKFSAVYFLLLFQIWRHYRLRSLRVTCGWTAPILAKTFWMVLPFFIVHEYNGLSRKLDWRFLRRFVSIFPMQACSMPSCGVYLSVCRSVTFVHFVKTTNHIFNFFSPLGSPTIVVFPYQTSWQYSDGDSLKGASNAGAVWNKSRFWTNIWLSMDDCCSARSTIDGRRCSSVSQLRYKPVYRTDRHASVNTPKRTECNCAHR